MFEIGQKIENMRAHHLLGRSVPSRKMKQFPSKLSLISPILIRHYKTNKMRKKMQKFNQNHYIRRKRITKKPILMASMRMKS